MIIALCMARTVAMSSALPTASMRTSNTGRPAEPGSHRGAKLTGTGNENRSINAVGPHERSFVMRHLESSRL
jgi:hypothetical protein